MTFWFQSTEISLVVIREAVVPCIEHTVVIEHVVLPYFVRSQVKATLNAPSGGIPNFIPTGWCEFKCRATLLCDVVTWETNFSLSQEKSRDERHRIAKARMTKTRNKDKCHRLAKTPCSSTSLRRHRERVGHWLGHQGKLRWGCFALQASGSPKLTTFN